MTRKKQVSGALAERWRKGVKHDLRSIAFHRRLKRIDSVHRYGFFDGSAASRSEVLMYLFDMRFERLAAGTLIEEIKEGAWQYKGDIHSPRSIALYRSLAQIDWEDAGQPFRAQASVAGDVVGTLLYLFDWYFATGDLL
jgi:hypothetical protein